MAAVTINFGPEVPGSRKEVLGVITFDSSYPTGGEDFTPAEFGLSRLDFLQVSGANGYVAVWDGSTSAPKVLMFSQNGSTGALTQAANGANLSTVTARFRAVGA